MFLVGSKASAIEGSLHVPSIVFRFVFMAVKSHVLRAFVDLVHVNPSERKNARKCILNYSSFACSSVSPLLWLHNKSCLSQQKMFKVNGVAFHLVFCSRVISSLSIDKNMLRMQTTLTNLQDVLGFFWSVCTKLAMQTLVKDK